MRAWRDVVNSPMEDSFAIAWLIFKDEVCGLFPLFVEYVEETVLPLKKPTNEHNPTNLDTPEKPKQEIEVMDEDEEYALSLV